MNVWGDERLRWWMSGVMNVWFYNYGWWMSEVMNVGVMNVWFWVGGDESPRWWMSEFSQGVMNVWGDECPRWWMSGWWMSDNLKLVALDFKKEFPGHVSLVLPLAQIPQISDTICSARVDPAGRGWLSCPRQYNQHFKLSGAKKLQILLL